MENKDTQIKHAITFGYPLDFGLVIEKSFENYKKIALLGGATILLLMIALIGIGFTMFTAFMGVSDLTETLTDFNPLNFSTVGILIYIGVMVLISGLFSPIGAGFLKMAHLAEENKEFTMGTVFDYYKTIHFKELFISASLLAVVNLGISTTLDSMGLTFLGTIITYIIGFLTFLTAPLIIFANQNAFEAITKSAQLIIKNPFIIFGLIIVGIIGIFIGLIGLCIGVFFTMPFWYSLTYTIYNNIVPINEESEIEEIGNNLE